MNIEEVRSYALSLPGVTEDQPFGEDNVTFRVEGKIFLCLWLGRGGFLTMAFLNCKIFIFKALRNHGARSDGSVLIMYGPIAR